MPPRSRLIDACNGSTTGASSRHIKLPRVVGSLSTGRTTGEPRANQTVAGAGEHPHGDEVFATGGGGIEAGTDGVGRAQGIDEGIGVAITVTLYHYH